MTINGAENSTGQSAVFKIHVNTKIIVLVAIHFTDSECGGTQGTSQRK